MYDNEALNIFMQVLGYMGAVGIAIFSLPELINVFKSRKTSHLKKSSCMLFTLLMCSSAFFFISGFYTAAKLTSEGTDASFNFAVAAANVFSFLTPATIMTYKLISILIAKKHGITEEELEQRRASK